MRGQCVNLYTSLIQRVCNGESFPAHDTIASVRLGCDQEEGVGATLKHKNKR